jgi:hypothetical protein
MNDYKNASEELQARFKQLREQWGQENPGKNFKEAMRSEETQLDFAEWERWAEWSMSVSLTELFVTLRADYEAAIEQSEFVVTNRMLASIQALLERQQIERLREEYADDENFLAAINETHQNMALCFRALDEGAEVGKLDQEQEN